MDQKALAGALKDRLSVSSESSAGLKSNSTEWIAIQRNTFSNWMNTKIMPDYPEIEDEDLSTELQNGVPLIILMEKCSGKPSKKYNKNPKLKHNKVDNLNIAFDFIKSEGITLVNMGPQDVEAGNEKLILGLLWTLIYHFQIREAFKNAPQAHGKKGGAKEMMLEWVRSKIPEYNIKNLTTDWNDGRAFCALTNAVGGAPELIPNHSQMIAGSARKNAETALATAEEHLGIPRILEVDDITNPALDELSVMCYLAYFRNASRIDQTKKTEPEPASEPAPEPEPVEAEAEQSSQNEDKNKSAGSSAPTLQPWERAADWREYTGKDLGGRCKIRVYFSLTTSSAVYRKRKEQMMHLFERMRVHERPDFEPWIPVDMDMEKSQRDAIFEKAGTRELPMLFVDDEYVGGYEQVMELNEANELEKVFQY